ncbi:iron dependent repressor, metal binding and dimerization domain protein [Clostridium cellulovorans]|uniref:Manganese transport regulator n=1 Tax=Clostridium cellulovorans (strain ATCC 35296 / DSM 3052 / OCM 3 / 743B) TaxID=573061 RepID=D9SRQ6_CLOC7|nr:iron dependent repressor, metal binding and dimerization domain protein [Clostridium cellulovorans]ADL50423.1 iron (metal) dependent repressor, DtxR family [Clostridium cellulovorans 743B]
MKDSFFHTFNEYMKKEHNVLTASMEDYLEMIYRLSINDKFTRIKELASALNVQPSSATKMVQRLSELKLLKYEKYGLIIFEEKGRVLGELLYRRHIVVEEFFKLIGVGEEHILEDTEKVEHTISINTLNCFEHMTKFFKENPENLKDYINYLSKQGFKLKP